MKLFDILGGKCVIHADFLAIPTIRRFWENSEDKQHANNVLSFIILCDYWDSPYVKSMNDDIREEKLKEEFFLAHTPFQAGIMMHITKKLWLFVSSAKKSMTKFSKNVILSLLLLPLRLLTNVVQTLMTLSKCILRMYAQLLQILQGYHQFRFLAARINQVCQ